MNNNRIVTIIALAGCLAGCSIDEPPRFNGSSCGGTDIPFLGILGDKSLSDKRSRAPLARHVVVSDNMVKVDGVAAHDGCDKHRARRLCHFVEIPVTITYAFVL